MTNASPTGEPVGASATEAAEARLLAAQVELVMAAPPLVMAVRVLEACFAATERAMADLPADATATAVRQACHDRAVLLQLYLRAVSQHAARLSSLANDLAIAAGLDFHSPD